MAVNQSSLSVVFEKEILTTITTAATANIGLMAAPFELGPVEEIVDISSEKKFSRSIWSTK